MPIDVGIVIVNLTFDFMVSFTMFRLVMGLVGRNLPLAVVVASKAVAAAAEL